MKYAVVRGNETVARSRTSESAHRASRKKPFAAVSQVVEMNRARSVSKGTVSAVLAGNSIVLRPKGFLGRELFDTYRFATAPARYDREAQAQIAPIGHAASIMQQLRDKGFDVEATPELLSAIATSVNAPAAVDEGPKSRGLIAVTRRGQQAVFETKNFLGRENFEVYRTAIAGAKYDGKANVASFPVAVAIVKRLVDAGFSVSIDPDLAEELKSTVAKVKEDVDAGKERAEELDKRLRTKGLSLFGYQKDGIAWLSGRHNAMLFDEQGLGKTISALVSIPENAPVVVVCPASVKGVWKLEAAKWRPDFKVTILSGKKSFRWPEAGEMIVVNFDILPDDAGAAPPGTVIIGDEIQAVKAGTKTKRGARFRVLAKSARDGGGRSWGLTGTPLMNRPQELWNILMAFGLAEEAFGSWKQFVDTFNGTPGEWGGFEWGVPRKDAGEKIGRVSLRRVRKEVLPDLPTKVYQQIPVELDPKTKRSIDKALRDAGIDVDKIIAILSASGEVPPFTELSAAREILAEAKIPALLDMVEGYEEAEEPIVVFSAHRSPIDMLGTRPGWATITGDVKPEERTEIVADFQAGKLKGVAITIKAGGTGLTLTRASTSIFVDKMWTPGENEQAEDRICRIGQTRGCNIKEMVADHAIDERVYELLAKKRVIIDNSIDASTTTSAKSSELADVDFDALAALARAEAEAADRRARDIAEVREKLAAMSAEERKRAEREREEEKRRRREQERDERAEGRARRLDGGGSGEVERRQARSDIERWAEQGIMTLQDLDPDAAYFRNDVGFSKADGGAGHWLAGQIRSGDGLTSGGWKLALQLAYRYQGQIGGPPSR